jgi:hypothetical protein
MGKSLCLGLALLVNQDLSLRLPAATTNSGLVADDKILRCPDPLSGTDLGVAVSKVPLGPSM